MASCNHQTDSHSIWAQSVSCGVVLIQSTGMSCMTLNIHIEIRSTQHSSDWIMHITVDSIFIIFRLASSQKCHLWLGLGAGEEPARDCKWWPDCCVVGCGDGTKSAGVSGPLKQRENSALSWGWTMWVDNKPEIKHSSVNQIIWCRFHGT